MQTSAANGDLLTLTSFASTEEELPRLCASGNYYVNEDPPGWCYGGVDLFYGYTNDAVGCWNACNEVFATYGYGKVIACDWWENHDGACYCQVRESCHP